MDDLRTAAAPRIGGNALPIGHLLHEFRIEGLIGEGGFSLVYRARDTQLQRVVAIKEYMPAGLASRGDDLSVAVASARQRETFELGLRSFVNEARLLASFDHPALVKVYRFWEQHGTAYMVMPLYQGPTLKQWLADRPPPDEAWLKALLVPLLEALETIHSDHCYHRDIAPDNILLLGADRPLLLDFGAARRVIGDATQALTIILKPGYAPVEQYAEVPAMKQGPWTDVYALCAVLYRAISGQAPAPSVGRMLKDDLAPAWQVGRGRYAAHFLAAIDAGLAVQPGRRPQDIAALRAALFTPGALEAEDTNRQPLDDAPTVIVPPRRSDIASTDIVADPGSRPDRARRPATPSATRPRGSSRGAWAIAAAVGAAVLAGAGWWLFERERPQPPAPSSPGAEPAAARRAPPVATAPAVAAAPTAAVAPPESRQANPPSAAPPAPSRTFEPFSVRAALEEVLAASDPAFGVTLTTPGTRLVIGRDRLRLSISSQAPGYLYVFLANADGTQLYRFFPNQFDTANKVAANRTIKLPRNDVQIDVQGPPGTDRVLAVVSEHPRDFAGSGFDPRDSLYDLAVVERQWSKPERLPSELLGAAVCGAPPCGDRFGAALVQYEVVAR